MNNRASNLNLAFSTPIWTSIVKDYKEINKRMLTYIEDIKKSDPNGKIRSNVVGWHSQNFNLQEPEPIFFINSISKIINESLKDMEWDLKKNELKISGMWTIINPSQASNARHIHSNNFISAAYYVKAPEDSGEIVFYDPRAANEIRSPIINTPNKLNSNTFSVSPQEGLLVLFPSYLHHSVNINKSTKERIVISFNINLIY